MNPAVKRGAQLVVSDRKQMVCAGNAYSHYEAEIVNTGAGLTKCQFLADSVKIIYNSEQTTLNCVSRGERYRFGFNGQEKDDEMYGEGNSYTAEYWQYDPRLGRRWNIDPLISEFPWQSTYVVFNNAPIHTTDPKGLKGESTDVTKNSDGTYTVAGGNAYDGDKGIYVVDDKGKRTGEKIGVSLTPQSFYFSDAESSPGAGDGQWHSIINPNDKSGINYLNNEIVNTSLTLLEYMPNATGGKHHDFKRHGTTRGDANYDNIDYFYRGMPLNGQDLSKVNIKTDGYLTVY